LIPNPILKVLSTLSCHMVRHLLIGGQACVFYGAAEFSRDCDVVIFADDENLRMSRGFALMFFRSRTWFWPRKLNETKTGR